MLINRSAVRHNIAWKSKVHTSVCRAEDTDRFVIREIFLYLEVSLKFTARLFKGNTCGAKSACEMDSVNQVQLIRKIFIVNVKCFIKAGIQIDLSIINSASSEMFTKIRITVPL